MNPVLTLVQEVLTARGPTLGAIELVCIDGPAGAGKTTLAEQLAHVLDFAVVHLDDLYPGWEGLDSFEPLAREILDALADGRPASYPRYDWHARAYAERVEVPERRGLVLEGVGAGNRALAERATVLVWVQATEQLCDQRWLARDGELMVAHRAAWRAAEAELFAREGTPARADVVVGPPGSLSPDVGPNWRR